MKTMVHRPKIGLIIFFVMLGLFVFLMPTQAQAADYYVDKNHTAAADSNPGTEAQPFLTIQRGVNLAQPGDTVLIKGSLDPNSPDAIYTVTSSGIFPPRPGSAGQIITVKAYPGHTVIISGPAPTTSYGVALDHASYHSFIGLKFQNFSKATEGQATGKSDILFDHCEFSDTTKTGMRLRYITNLTIRDCYVHDCFEAGISIRNSTNVLVERTESSYNDDGLGAAGDGDGFHTLNCGTVSFVDCIARGNSEDGFDVTANATLTRCISADSTACGIKFWRRSDDGYAEKTYTVINSLLYGNGLTTGGSGIEVDLGSSVNLYNNVIYGNGAWGVRFEGVEIEQGPAIVYSKLVNNIIAGNGVAQSEYGVAVSQNGPNTNQVDADHNIYFNNARSNVRSGLNSDTNAIAGQDPLFSSPTTSDFHLQKGSPAVDAGLDLSSLGINIDIIGTSRPQDGDGDGIAKYDIGAYEYIGPIIIDHNCADLSKIPDYWLEKAKQMQVHYAHTSHGSQITTGLLRLESADPKYSVAIRTSGLPVESGALRIFDGQETVTYITPDLYWSTQAGLTNTQNVLNHNPGISISEWAWCTQLNSYTEAQVNSYLDAMVALEAANPGVKFVYMTGTAQYSGGDGFNRHQRNEQIRKYCRDNDKVLFDFADLDAWYNNEQATYQYTYNSIAYSVPYEHNHYVGNEAGHTTYESCENKGRAYWWMMARLAGWNATQDALVYGDVNGVGGVDANDASLTAMAAVGLITLNGEQIRKADVNNIGGPDANDASLIAQYAVGLIDKFPVEG